MFDTIKVWLKEFFGGKNSTTKAWNITQNAKRYQRLKRWLKYDWWPENCSLQFSGHHSYLHRDFRWCKKHNIGKYITTSYKSSRILHTCMGGFRLGDRGSGPPQKNPRNIGFHSNTGPNPLKKHKATKPAFNVGPSSARQGNAF